jgi:hypothetical protein
VVRIGGFKNLLEVVFGWFGAPLEITLGCRYELLIRVLDFLPGIAVVRHHGKTTREVLLPLLAALSALLGAFDGDTGGCGSATTGGRSRLSQSEGGPNSLLTQGVSGCDVDQLLGGFRLLAAELVDQRAARSAILEGRDEVSVDHTRELVTFL